MKRSQLTKILIEGDAQLLKELSSQIEQAFEVKIVKVPERSLVMTKARDSVSHQPFYFGEVLVTECTVSVNDTYGFGVLMGEEAERAYQLAVVDCAINAKLTILTEWNKALMEEEEKIRNRHLQEMALVMKTKVNFDTKEEYNG